MTTLNVTNIRILARALRDLTLAKEGKLGFSMATVRSTGGEVYDQSGYNNETVGCIAAWANAVLYNVFDDGDKFSANASEAFGFTKDDGRLSELFMPYGWLHDPQLFPPSRVADVLDHLAETGEVKW